MTSSVEAAQIEVKRATSWALWRRQVAAIMRLEVRKNLFGKRAALMYLLAALPVFLVFAMVTFPETRRELANPGDALVVFANLYEALILRTVVFFGSAWVFMNLFRGEIVDRSLHYYFLAAVRREVLVVGKYLSGLVAASILFTGATLVCVVLNYVPRGAAAAVEHLSSGPGLKHAASYLAITALGVVGYGAMFLVIGLFFRNPIIPALAVYGWEWINFLLPPILKKVSVVHYLQSLTPVPVSEGPFAIVAEPTPAWIAVPLLLGLSAVFVTFAARRIRHMEIKYGTD
jgi:ABC-type transport system involved in multi-copper enzyme maturation permease subunit